MSASLTGDLGSPTIYAAWSAYRTRALPDAPRRKYDVALPAYHAGALDMLRIMVAAAERGDCPDCTLKQLMDEMENYTTAFTKVVWDRTR